MLKAIKERVSVRQYSDQPIKDKKIENILEAGLTTATAFNLKAYKLLIIKKEDGLQDVLAPLTFHQQHIKDASFLVFIYTLTKNSLKIEDVDKVMSYLEGEKRVKNVDMYFNLLKRENSHDLIGQAYAIASTMTIQATEDQIGSTIFSGFDPKGIKEMFNDQVPESFTPILGISFGYKHKDFKSFSYSKTKDKIIFNKRRENE